MRDRVDTREITANDQIDQTNAKLINLQTSARCASTNKINLLSRQQSRQQS
jgi:hypothetical protein